MKSKLLVSILVAGISSSVFAAKPELSSSTLSSALEVLKLPGENRRNAIIGHEDKFSESFATLAFDSQQPMSVRWHALMALTEARGEKATDDLIKASNNDQWYMRNASLVALQDVNPAQAQKTALKLLKDKALVVRSASVTVLANHLSPEVRDTLWGELNQGYNFKNSQSLWIRHQIVETLAKSPQAHEGKMFAQLLGDKDARVQLPAVAGLEKITGTKLGKGQMKQSQLVMLWKDYVRKGAAQL